MQMMSDLACTDRADHSSCDAAAPAKDPIRASYRPVTGGFEDKAADSPT